MQRFKHAQGLGEHIGAGQARASDRELSAAQAQKFLHILPSHAQIR